MRVEEGECRGDLRVTEELELRGTVLGTITVAGGGNLSLRGACSGEVIVEAGGTASIHGAVAGGAVNRGGDLNVHGAVVGPVRAEKGQTFLATGAKVLGGLHGTIVVACAGCGQQLNIPTDRGELALKCPKCQASWTWSATQYSAAGAAVHVVQSGPGSPQTPRGPVTPEQANRVIGLLWCIFATLLVIVALLGALLVRFLLK